MPRSTRTAYNIPQEKKDRLDEFHAFCATQARSLLGYPVNMRYDYADLYKFFAFTINNVGDPFDDGLYHLNTKKFEREVLAYFGSLYHTTPEESWGYVTNGGTEGNMYGLYLAREIHPNGVVFLSEDTHYSVSKTVRVLGIPSIMVRSQKNGEIDYLDLEKMIQVKRDHPIIVVANIGTTMKGAVDDVSKIRDILKRNAIQNHYIHCDAALGGMILPFLDGAPLFDFRLQIDSLAISGHKMVGSPVPCGVVLAKKKHVDAVRQEVEYIGAKDTTLSGSRNGHAVLFLWYALSCFGTNGFREVVGACMENAAYALKKFQEISWDAWLNPWSNTVVFKRPSEEVVQKWQLAVSGDITHLITMPNVTKEQIDALIADLT